MKADRWGSALGLAMIALCGPAAAADLGGGLKDEAGYLPPVFSWSGFYAGINGGWAWTNTDASASVAPFPPNNINDNARAIALGALNGNLDGDGFAGGVTIGANSQTGNLVFGVEGDFNYLDLSEDRNSGIVSAGVSTGVGNDRLEADWLATLRLRWGLASGSTLYYVTGGAAFTDATVTRTMDWSFSDGCPAVGGGLQRCHSGSADFNVGWTVGGGIEHAFDNHWTIKGEYLYADFGSEDFNSSNAGTVPNQTMNHSFDMNMHIARLGLNYKF